MELDYYKNKTILVTGASGYIGSALVGSLKKASCKVIALDRKTDIRKKDIWRKYVGGVDILFHLAAQTSSQVSNQNPTLDAEVNLLPVINLLQTCQKNNFFPDIIFAGTVTQIGLTKNYPVDESFKDRPITVYDINKLAAEKYLQYYATQTKGRAVTLRLSNVYGPGPKSSRQDRGILNFFVRQALQGKNLTVYTGNNFIRDYVYIDDVVSAFLTAGTRMDKINGNYYIIGSGKGWPIRKMVGLIKDQVGKKTGKRVKIISILPPKDLSPIEFRNFIADATTFKKLTGWRQSISLKEGIKRTIEYIMNE